MFIDFPHHLPFWGWFSQSFAILGLVFPIICHFGAGFPHHLPFWGWFSPSFAILGLVFPWFFSQNPMPGSPGITGRLARSENNLTRLASTVAGRSHVCAAAKSGLALTKKLGRPGGVSRRKAEFFLGGQNGNI